ncbi:uncharacterized protein PHACADRAFT_265028 [Phanerochaete carnosa HHB-10118-sp]|uniref:Zn(2)-C6 fungal-type domain-containing protein n=1 Tax=Phanerochaete carnosa (strain HHB-10118-sp) TaxID=650164 RepID=K5WH25_PHACS|nr:uncharacterized protein PHACADRAFT_265028 [Phanerochaete carnosa HHB-10118-sp]EKM49512.1 hypothetical protein PHACADRAFT_265028 [Phanerochaete carnosa HHB-10118-sp]
MYSSSEDSALSAYPSRSYDPALSDDRSAVSRSSASRSPPAEADPLAVGHGADQAPAKAPSKRREKPRIDLAPDQPLTTQGKPRARVYVACVQCRTRKIRCDGAKPVCHNCSRRVATGADDATPCTYDAAPKRRGPDRNPGSRQRVPPQETTEGGKVRRRRRRGTGPSPDRGAPMAAPASIHALASSGDVLAPEPRVPQISAPALAPAYALEPLAPSQASSSRTVRADDIYRTPQQGSVAARVDEMGTSNAGHVSSLRGIIHPSNNLQRLVTVSEPPYSHAQISPVQQSFAQQSPIQGTPYASYVSANRSSSSHVSREFEYDEDNDQNTGGIGPEPSMQLARDTWWDALLSMYSSHAHPLMPGGAALTPGVRDTMSQRITADLRFLFRASNYWFAFFNVPRFFARLLDPVKRSSLQPSIVLAALAAANFIRSSEQEDGATGRSWALTLLQEAQGSLESSINARWIDESLVQASWLIAFFEISAHPLHNAMRVRSALSMLDSLIRSLAMSALDRDDHRVSRFATRSVPTVASAEYAGGGRDAWDLRASHAHAPGHALPPQPPARAECACQAYTLGSNWGHAQELTPLWLMTPAWREELSEAEVRKEECRRLVWSAVMMVAGYTSYMAANNVMPTIDLTLMEPANYALLFPGEELMRASAGGKESVWALYMRTILLWHSCVRMRWDPCRADAEKAQFAVQAWLEVDKIQKALDAHTCGVERAFLFQGREYLFNTRMCISFEFRRYIPQVNANTNMVFHRQKAEEWLKHQASIAKRTMYGLQSITGQPNVTLARRPFFGSWFMSQVSRALLLWSCDHSLIVALEVAKALLDPIEYLMSMWPCPDQRKRYGEIRTTLDRACYAAGIPPPSPGPQHPGAPPEAAIAPA